MKEWRVDEECRVQVLGEWLDGTIRELDGKWAKVRVQGLASRYDVYKSINTLKERT